MSRTKRVNNRGVEYNDKSSKRDKNSKDKFMGFTDGTHCRAETEKNVIRYKNVDFVKYDYHSGGGGGGYPYRLYIYKKRNYDGRDEDFNI